MKTINFIMVFTYVFACLLIYQSSMITGDLSLDERKAMEIGKYFLDGVGRETGKFLVIKFELKTPNFYGILHSNQM